MFIVKFKTSNKKNLENEYTIRKEGGKIFEI